MEYSSEDSKENNTSINGSTVTLNLDVYPNLLENELDIKIGLNGNEDLERYKQIIYEYYLKSEDLENKCVMLHRNLLEVKGAWDKTKNLKESALKDKEIMTLKFAKGEKQMLNEKEAKEKAEKRCKELTKEIEILQKKLQIKTDEKNRITVLYDNKMHELKNMKSENEGIMNQNCILKNELKLCQIALKNQVELHGKSQLLISELNERIETFTIQRDELETNRKQASDLILKMKRIEIDRNEKEQLLKELHDAFDELSLKYHALLMENNTFSDRIQTLESNLFEYKNLLNHEAFNIDNFFESRDSSATELNKGENALDELKQKLDFLETKNKELENDIKSCRIRETDTLQFSQQVAEKNAILQTENYNLHNILENLNTDKNNLKQVLADLKQKFIVASKQVSSEKEKSQHENMKINLELDSLRKKFFEQNRQYSRLQQQLMDQQHEIAITKRKQNCLLKELRKEVTSCKNNHESVSSSCSSSMSLVSNLSKSTCQSQVEVIQPENTINQNVLIARILRLQKTVMRKSEKIDYLECRIDSLLFDLHKKKRLLQFYLLREQAGTLTSNQMEFRKKDLRKFGGVMASLYDGRKSDRNLTLGLSLEINCKLQAVLEDALLKNIILKDSIEILGAEIDKLKREPRKA